MTTTLSTLFAIIAGMLALFAIAIVVGLRTRRTQMARSLTIRARDLALPGTRPDDLLYAIRQDFSAAELGLIVRDGRDEEIGRITFHIAKRTGAFTIDLGHDSFEADVMPTMKQRIVLHPAGAASTVLCTFDRRMWGTHRFDVAGAGTIECRPESRLRFVPVFRFTQDGHAMGMSQQIGGAINRGVMLVLPSTIPLPVRVFILAIQT